MAAFYLSGKRRYQARWFALDYRVSMQGRASALFSAHAFVDATSMLYTMRLQFGGTL
jgi:hypothetical protein